MTAPHALLSAHRGDRSAAEQMVDDAFDYVGADEPYRERHREHMVRQHQTWCRFERRMAERRACRAVGVIAEAIRNIVERHRVLGRIEREEAA